MEEKDKILLAQNWVRQLANGINPLNGSVLKEEDVVNNVHISRCLFYVADLLGKYSERRTKVDDNRTVPFTASAILIEKYNYVEAISISAFAREIKNLIPRDMQAVSNASMIKWLMQEGLIRESEPDTKGRINKIATEKGKEIGIFNEDRENNGGHYLATLYNREAQRYLLDHMDEMSRIH